jgi:hypothetical protein
MITITHTHPHTRPDQPPPLDLNGDAVNPDNLFTACWICNRLKWMYQARFPSLRGWEASGQEADRDL